MMDFRRVDIAKQKAYDLLRDWIKLVARHTNPDQDISELLGWLWKLKPATPDPITGLAPCGCGGRAQMVVNGWKEFSAFCPNCGFESAQYPSEEDVKIKWNAMRGVKEADK